MKDRVRIEHDTLGEVQVPVDALWGAQTQRAIDNFPISGFRMSPVFIRVLGQLRRACAQANVEMGNLACSHRRCDHPGVRRNDRGSIGRTLPC